MPDKIDKLRDTISELKVELAQLESLDVETQQLLEETMGQIDSAIHAGSAASLEHHSLADRLKGATNEFEESHPTLSRIVGNLIDALGQMGI